MIPDVPGLKGYIVPGSEGARIDIHPLNVFIDPLVCRMWGLTADCLAKSELH